MNVRECTSYLALLKHTVTAPIPTVRAVLILYHLISVLSGLNQMRRVTVLNVCVSGVRGALKSVDNLEV